MTTVQILVLLISTNISITTQELPTNISSDTIIEADKTLKESERLTQDTDDHAIEVVKYVVNDSDQSKDITNRLTKHPRLKNKSEDDMRLNHRSNKSNDVINDYSKNLDTSNKSKRNNASSFEREGSSFESSVENEKDYVSAEQRNDDNDESRELNKSDSSELIKGESRELNKDDSPEVTKDDTGELNKAAHEDMTTQVYQKNDDLLDDVAFRKMLPNPKDDKPKEKKKSGVTTTQKTTPYKQYPKPKEQHNKDETNTGTNVYGPFILPSDPEDSRRKSYNERDDIESNSDLLYKTLKKLSLATEHPISPFVKQLNHIQSYSLLPIYARPATATRQIYNPLMTYYPRLKRFSSIPLRTKYIVPYVYRRRYTIW